VTIIFYFRMKEIEKNVLQFESLELFFCVGPFEEERKINTVDE